MTKKKRTIKLLIMSVVLLIPVHITLAYYFSSDDITNSLKTEKYSIKINADGGNISEKLIIKNNKVKLPAVNKDGFEFLGYSLTNNGNIVYQADDEVDIDNINNITLYVNWNKKSTSINAIEKIKELAESDTDNLIKDDNTPDHNIRYYGANPNNYVKFDVNDTDTWRIVGLFNNIEDSNGTKGQRLKLVRDVSIGKFVWDNDPKDIGNGSGVNEWPDADLMKLLNPSFDNYMGSSYSSCEYDYDLGDTVCQKISDNEKINNSLWWNNQKGICYNLPYNRVTDCDFTIGDSKGLSVTGKSMIEDVVWNLGGIHDLFYDDEFGTAQHFYNYERDSIVYDCSEDTRKCPRSTKWTGKVALLYPSDYGFAVGDGNSMTREQCLNITLNHWGVYDNGDCANYNYLNKGNTFFLSPMRDVSYNIMIGNLRGHVSRVTASFPEDVYPSVFLKQNIYIVSGTGTSGDPYILGTK